MILKCSTTTKNRKIWKVFNLFSGSARASAPSAKEKWGKFSGWKFARLCK